MNISHGKENVLLGSGGWAGPGGPCPLNHLYSDPWGPNLNAKYINAHQKTVVLSRVRGPLGHITSQGPLDPWLYNKRKKKHMYTPSQGRIQGGPVPRRDTKLTSAPLPSFSLAMHEMPFSNDSSSQWVSPTSTAVREVP